MTFAYMGDGAVVSSPVFFMSLSQAAAFEVPAFTLFACLHCILTVGSMTTVFLIYHPIRLGNLQDLDIFIIFASGVNMTSFIY